jgi:hypothetical protein
MQLKNTLKYIGFLAAMAPMLALSQHGVAQHKQQVKVATAPRSKFWQRPAIKAAIDQTMFLMRYIQPDPDLSKSFLKPFESNPQQLKYLSINPSDLNDYAEDIQPGAETNFLSVSKILDDPQVKANQVSHVVFAGSKNLQGYDMPPQIMAVADLRQLQTEFEKMQQLANKAGMLYIPFAEKMDHTDDRANTRPITPHSMGVILPFGCLVRQTPGSLTGVIAHEVGHHAVKNSNQTLVATELHVDNWVAKNGYGSQFIDGLMLLESTPRNMKVDDFKKMFKPDLHPPTPIRIMSILGYLKDHSITPDIILGQFGLQNVNPKQPKLPKPVKLH